jgi:transposase-like protein
MSKIAEKEEKIKTLSQALEKDTITQLSLAKYFTEASLLLINELLESEVSSLAGEKYSRDKPHEGRYFRWGKNPGSVRIGEEKVPLNIPRVYDREHEQNVSLENYRKLKEAEPDEQRLLKGILYGLGTGDYGDVVRSFTDSFGLSRSSVSRRFVERSTEAVKEFYERDLSVNRFIALFIDGKYLAKEQMVIVLGVTDQGEKIPLSFIQTNTENSRSIKQLLTDLISRGFKCEDGLLCVIDGAKGLRKAIEEVFGTKAVVQRCQWHKRENVLSYLKESDKEIYKKKLNRAYSTEDYEGARLQLEDIIEELRGINIYASNSLKEGLEETLTIHRLGLKADFGKSFSTTNIIENLNSQLVKYIGRVKYWKTSDQRQRWIASALIEIEHKMRRVDNFRNLDKMQNAIRKEIENRNL